MEKGHGSIDLMVSLTTREVDGKRAASVHLKKEWAEAPAKLNAARDNVVLCPTWFTGVPTDTVDYTYGRCDAVLCCVGDLVSRKI